MMGWAMLALIAATAAALLVVLRVPRALWTLAGAFLMLGAAGYAYQGQPDLAASPVTADAVKYPVEPTYRQMRDALYGRFNADSLYFAISDARLAAGDATFAARVLSGRLRSQPDDVALWSELGNVIAIHDGGIVSPAAAFAFERAMTIAPRHPGPAYFLGYAYVRAGEYAKARPYWARAVALSPPTAGYRAGIAARLVLLDACIANSPDCIR